MDSEVSLKWILISLDLPLVLQDIELFKTNRHLLNIQQSHFPSLKAFSNDIYHPCRVGAGTAPCGPQYPLTYKETDHTMA